MKKSVGIIGSRGMVGSVLIKRMQEEHDFELFEALCFSTSQQGQDAPDWSSNSKLLDAYNIDELKKCDVLLTCQGSDYTHAVHQDLRTQGWQGLWIDAASALRYEKSSCLVLDPLNRDHILSTLKEGTRDFIGANCTVSLLLMGLAGLFKNDLIEFVSTASYQAISGAGARAMKELLGQMGHLAGQSADMMDKNILDIDQTVSAAMTQANFPTEQIGVPLAGNVLPWIDKIMDNGQTKEEWKAMEEANKILNRSSFIPIDGTCVRVGSMRSHAQAATIKLKKEMPLEVIEGLLKEAHEWVHYVPNEREQTLKELTPAFTSGSLKVSVGRLRSMRLGPEYINLFTVGDQLLWGAAEPLRRFLRVYLEL